MYICFPLPNRFLIRSWNWNKMFHSFSSSSSSSCSIFFFCSLLHHCFVHHELICCVFCIKSITFSRFIHSIAIIDLENNQIERIFSPSFFQRIIHFFFFSLPRFALNDYLLLTRSISKIDVCEPEWMFNTFSP